MIECKTQVDWSTLKLYVVKFLESCDTRLAENLVCQLDGENVAITNFRPIIGWGIDHFIEAVFHMLRETDRAVAGNCPRSGRPDHYRAGFKIFDKFATSP